MILSAESWDIEVKSMKTFRKIASFIIILAMLATTVSCSSGLVFDKGKILDSKTGIYYGYAPNTYEAIAVSNNIYSVWEQNNVEVAYHAIEGLPTDEYLVDEYGYIICAVDKVLPDLDGFAPTSALICTNTEVAVSIGEINEKAKVFALVELYMNGESVNFENTAIDTLEVKFISEKYPNLYFNLSVMIEEDNSVYLWNRDNGKYINVGNMLDQYVESYFGN